MALIEMIMPKMGESVMEATILSWLKKEGEKIEQDEAILEVATDKVDTEVPATQAGVLKQILVQEGEVVAVGNPIAVISIEASEEKQVAKVNGSSPKVEHVTTEKQAYIEPAQQNIQEEESSELSDRFYSPLVLSIAKEERISKEELDKIEGTGKEGRVTKKDILDFLENKSSAFGKESEHTPENFALKTEKPGFSSQLQVTTPQVLVTASPGDEIVAMDRMRKMISERMVSSKQISAHVTSFVEADVTNIAIWRNKTKDLFAKEEGTSLTFTPIFIEAVIKAIKDFPMINISVDGDKIIKRKEINIGIAVALPTGNLIVPVIKNADQLNLVGLAKKVNDLADRARTNKLKAEELSGGTYTVTNIGSFGNLMGTPIIMQPQVAILALGAIVKKPVVIETPQGDTIGIRHRMYLSHAYDHRVVDGALGGMFVKKVADYFEQFDLNRKF